MVDGRRERAGTDEHRSFYYGGMTNAKSERNTLAKRRHDQMR